jgi:eukaryotic-like serine/threonine-protein kinase
VVTFGVPKCATTLGKHSMPRKRNTPRPILGVIAGGSSGHDIKDTSFQQTHERLSVLLRSPMSENVARSQGEDRQSPHDDPLIGRLLADRWRVEKLLGRGGMSSVYSATHRNGKKVAIKVLNSELTAVERARSRFLSEGYIANRVQHDGVVAVLDDHVTDDGIVFLVMDLLEGKTLEEHREHAGGKLPPSEVVAVADAVLDILVAAHAKGVVHRDIKPSNVFLTTKGKLVLLDFGIASLRELPFAQGSTHSGVVLGTPGFLAPEQARGRWREIDARTDVWGVGATMFRLLTGRLVHDGETANDSVIAVATKPAPSILSIDPTMPREVAACVDRALESNPADRWQNAAEMLDALRAAKRQLPPCELPKPETRADHATLDESFGSLQGAVPPAIVARSADRRSVRNVYFYGAAGACALAGVLAVMQHRTAETPSAGARPNTQQRVASLPNAATANSIPTESAAVDAGLPSVAPSPLSSAPRLDPTSAHVRARAIGPRHATIGGAFVSASAAPQAPGPPPSRLEDVLNEQR